MNVQMAMHTHAFPVNSLAVSAFRIVYKIKSFLSRNPKILISQ